jgi:hypothetical protein
MVPAVVISRNEFKLLASLAQLQGNRVTCLCRAFCSNLISRTLLLLNQAYLPDHTAPPIHVYILL